MTRAGIAREEAKSMIRLLLAARLGCSLTQLPLHFQEETDFSLLQPDLEQLEAGMPLQYLLGESEFMGLPFLLTPAVLIPRFDSEALVEQAIASMKEMPAPRIADVCTGSGAFALSLAYYLPEAEVVASDISPEALAVAKENARRLKVAERVRFYVGDLLVPLQLLGERYHLLTANPPYIRRGELSSLPLPVRREPRLALDGGVDGLDFYRRLAKEAGALLFPGGRLLLEHGDGQGDAVCRMLEAAGFSALCRICDYGGRERGVLATWK